MRILRVFKLTLLGMWRAVHVCFCLIYVDARRCRKWESECPCSAPWRAASGRHVDTRPSAGFPGIDQWFMSKWRTVYPGAHKTGWDFTKGVSAAPVRWCVIELFPPCLPEVLFGTGEISGDGESPWDMFTPAPDLLGIYTTSDSHSHF